MFERCGNTFKRFLEREEKYVRFPHLWARDYLYMKAWTHDVVFMGRWPRRWADLHLPRRPTVHIVNGRGGFLYENLLFSSRVVTR